MSALKLLRSYFPVVLSLCDYLSQICESGLALERPDDLERYISLMKTSYVALVNPLDASTTGTFKTGEVLCEMYEVIDRVQVRMFEQAKGKPHNILTMGYRRADHRSEYGRADMSRQAITNFFPNTNITALQALEWKILLARIGEAAMFHLLLKTCIFVALPHGCFCQLVGTPVTELKLPMSGFLSCLLASAETESTTKSTKRTAPEDRRPLKRRRTGNDGSVAPAKDTAHASNRKTQKGKPNATMRGPADISFVRIRMLHGRPIMAKNPDSGKQLIIVGLPLNHVLNCLAPVKLLANGDVPSKENIAGRDARHLLKYIFPRQFGLKNPFDITDQEQNIKTYESYIDRESEIKMRGNVKTPKRLKTALELVHQLIRRHWTCNYRGLRSIVCPSKLKKVKMTDRQDLDCSVILEMMTEVSQKHDTIITQAPLVNLSADSHPSLIHTHGVSTAEELVKSKPKFVEFMCSHNEVFRYVLKVTEAVIPKAFWGCRKNFKTVMKHVEQLINGRRFETITLNSVLQCFSTQECDWLLPENSRARHQRPSVTDAIKRRELVEDFLHWYFDSFVISLLRTSFYATESSPFRQRILFFRQDDWFTICRPLLQRLADGTFERLGWGEAQKILHQHQRKLGYSFIRLLPKDTGVRPIVNLRRKSSKTQPDGSSALSINQILQAAFQILSYEKSTQPDLLGASVFGFDEMYGRLKSLKTRLMDIHGSLPKLYFVKVDVRTCFDSIEQGKLLEILQNILSEDGYMIQRFARVQPVAGRIQRTFWKRAHPDADHPHFLSYAAKLASMLKNSIFVDQVVYAYEDREEILQLLKEHLTENIVKIGLHFYRQTVGIPQGSVLSSILCSFFYGDLERKEFKFTQDEESMLCRLIDDYLFVTADESKAKRFLDMMNAGHPEYGCFISTDKTLTNFDADESITNRTLPWQKDFPWCGCLINMNTLSVSVDYTRYPGTHIGDTLTVNRGRRPGAAFTEKMLQMTKLRCHVIFSDTSLNTEDIAHRNVYLNFLLAAMKMHRYVHDWGIDVGNKDTRKFLLGVIHRTIRYTTSNVRNTTRGRIGRAHGAKCTISKLSVIWLGTQAFWTVLKFKEHERFMPVMIALEFELGTARFARTRRRWAWMVKEASAVLEKVRF